MKKIHAFATIFVSFLLVFSASLRAEDTDLYVANSANGDVPNVLFVLDNGANFSANANGTGCTAYTGTTEAPSLGSSTASSILQCALVNAINSLPENAVNIGLVTANANSFGETQATTDRTRGGYHDLCNNSGVGGCVLRRLALMNAANKASLISFIKGWQLSNSNGGSTADQFLIKVNSATQSAEMQEAWAYYNGKTGLSGTTYSPSVLATGCQRNFIIYVSNTEKDMDGSATNTAAINALSASQVGATVGQLNPITGQVKFVPSVCSGQSSMNLTASNSGSDEWARLMYQQDGGANGNEGQQNIISYSIAILGPENKCSTDSIGLMASIAQQGGGKSFRTSNVQDLTDALSAVLNEVQAVNSVFASASLPVSVNAQGTYLNQIYMGMFRPDATGSPRWLGNLKQYQLVYDSTGSLVLGDARGNYAISSAGTGFITPSAVSFWTSKDTASVPDSTGGFFANNLEGALLSPYDLPDGEVVEKGGVAQQIRKENLTATFAGASNTPSSNPRRMYTYCPAGGPSCVPDLTHSSNDFSTLNANIAAASFGNTPGLKVTRLTRSGTTVTATTSGNHGLSAGAGVQISGVTTDTKYDGFFTLLTASGNTFTFTLPGSEYPTNSTIDYTVAKSTGGTSLTGVRRSSTTATVTSASDLSGFTVGSYVLINGFDQAEYNGVFQVLTNSGTSLTYTVTRNPPPTATNTYTASLATLISRDISGISTSGNGSNKVATVTTTAAHGFHVGQSVTLSGTGVAAYDGISFTIDSVPDSMNFTISPGSQGAQASKGTVTNDRASKTITSLTRSSTTATAATSATSNWFANGDAVTITKTGGTAGNESAYEQLSAVISCTSPCTTFTYTVATSPATPGSFTGTPTISVPTAVGNIAANGITRTSGSTTAQATMSTSFGTFANGDSVTISPTSGAAPATESAYVGTFTITCVSTCATFTISGVRVTPTTPVTDSNMMVFAGAMPPDRDTLIKWVRGQDNFGDEKGPGTTSPTVTVRPSVHADVLHSRPIVINYGDSRGIVVYYGTNDGVFHAINGQQTGSIGNAPAVPAGDELWGLVLPEHYPFMNRQRIAWPELKFPTTTLKSAQTKNYFVDGPTGAYQRLNADGTINAAYLYLTMRRGGRFIYALDVTQPQSPRYLWKIDPSSPVSAADSTPGFTELGQTWSRPKMTLLQSSAYRTTPALVFGAGYDPSEDSEPPGTDTMGRGVYIVNATNGELIWSASSSCATPSTATCLNVPGMTYAIPSDVTFVDQDYDGYTDKFYVGDLGGNVWRIDVSDALRTNWTVTKIAALGCNTGVCSSGTTPRKFFFPPSVLVVGSAGATGSYDAVSIMSGDREHPLKSTATGSAYQTADNFFMVKDTGTVVGTPSTNNLTRSSLFNATSTTWDGTGNGFYMSFATGEKGVNAPLSLNGVVYFATNTPVDRDSICSPNLGKATAYAVSPFSGEKASNVVEGGGLAPSAVAGVVEIRTTTTVNGEPVTTTKRESFCLGCGVSQLPGGGSNNGGGSNGPTPPQCKSFEDNCKSPVSIAGSLKRTYWYKK